MISQQQRFGLDDTHLIDVSSEHRLLAEVADKFTQMQIAASRDGHDLQICSSFRSFERQLSIWNRKWHGELPLNTLDGKQLDATQLTDDEKIHAIMLWSALPGASRHHWGTDFDVYDKTCVQNYKVKLNKSFNLVPEEYEANGPCAPLSSWLEVNAKTFGFYFPYAKYTGGVAREPWHLSYLSISQDIISTLSLDALAETLQNSSLQGKSSVLSTLPELFERYTLNNGCPPNA